MKISPLSNLANLQNENTAVAGINANNARITDAFNNTLSRDGSSPNEMEAALDMNSHRVINVSSPSSSLDVVNKLYVDSLVASITAAIEALASAGTAVVESNKLFPEQFGAVGDGVTDDFPALQLWLTAVALTGKEGHLTSGKTYYSNGSLLFTALASNPNNLKLVGYGASIKTNPALFQTNLTIRRDATSRFNECRFIVVEGFTFDQFSNPKSVCGLNIEAAWVTVRNCNFVGGSEGIAIYGAQTGLRLGQRDPLNFDSGAQLCVVENCNFHNAAVSPAFGITIEGQCNGSKIINCSIGAQVGISISIANGTVEAGDDFANGIIIEGNNFEDCDTGVYVHSIASSPATCQGLRMMNNRIEDIHTVWFSYSPQAESRIPPVVGPNYIVGNVTRYINSNFNIDIRDLYVGSNIIDPGSLAANTTTTIGTIAMPAGSAVAGDYTVVTPSVDLLGTTVTGYVSAPDTVTVRLTNPTSNPINVSSATWYASVRPSI